MQIGMHEQARHEDEDVHSMKRMWECARDRWKQQIRQEHNKHQQGRRGTCDSLVHSKSSVDARSSEKVVLRDRTMAQQKQSVEMVKFP